MTTISSSLPGMADPENQSTASADRSDDDRRTIREGKEPRRQEQLLLTPDGARRQMVASIARKCHRLAAIAGAEA